MFERSLATRTEALIRTHPLVAECAVLSMPGERQPRLAAFIVPRRPLEATQLVDALRSEHPDFDAPDVIVSVTTMPLRADGTVDEEALRALPRADEATAERAEAALKRQPGVEHAAVFVTPRKETRPPLHVADLLPAGNSVLPDASTEDLRADTEQAEAALDLPPALVTSASLADGANNNPMTLAASLAQSILDHPRARIRYLGDNGTEEAQSFADLSAEARRITAGLRAGGLAPGAFVIAQLTQSRDIIPFFWGCVFGGFVPLIAATPASYATTSNELEKLGHVWRLLDRPMIVTSADSQKSLLDAGAAFGLEAAHVLSIAELRRHAPEGELHDSHPDDIAFVNLSSGSTGVPKCIQLTHRNVLSRARGTNVLCEHEPADVILNWLPFDHIGSISDWHVRCIDLGCDMVYCSKERILGQPLEWLRIIDRYRISHSWAPNFAYALINAALSGAGSERWDLSSMKSLLTAGEAVSSSTVEELLTRLHDHGLRKTAVRTAFGMAELGSGITYSRPTDDCPVMAMTVDRASLKSGLREVAADHPRAITFVSLGPLIAGMSMRIVDDDNRVLPERTIGRLHVQGEAVSPGYYNNEEANKVFLADGWFETGDQGFIADGQLYLTGRSKDCIIVNGANYFPAEIEKVVEDLPGIEVSYTAAYSVRPPGSAREQVALFLCPTPTGEGELATLLRAIQQRVTQKIGLKADYIIPLTKADIPKTAIGKIQRKQLAAAFEAGQYDAETRRADLLLTNERTLPDWFAVPSWRPQALRPAWQDDKATAPVVLLDSAGLGLRVADRLDDNAIRIEHGRGGSAKLSERHYRLDTTDSAELGALLADLGSKLAAPLHVVDLRGYGRPPIDWSAKSESDIRRSIRDLQTLLAAVASARREGTSVRLSVVSSNSQPVASSDRLCPAGSLAPVLLRAAAADWNWLQASHIDVGCAGDDATLDALAQQLELELSHKSGEQEVAYRDGVRLVPGLDRPAFDGKPAGTALRSKALYVITGGLGGLGVELARMLLGRFGARVLLVGRTPLATDTTRTARLNALRALGPVDYVALDLARDGGGAALREAIDAAEKNFGVPLAGIFHLAGAFAEGRLSATSEAEIWDVLAPKVMGALAIEEAANGRPDVLLLHYSSAASQFPTETMPAYAAANRFLDAHAHHRQHALGQSTWAAGFSAWTDVGMNAEGASDAVLRSRGLSALTPRQGLDSLLALLARPPGHTLVGLRLDAPVMQRMLPGPVAAAHELNGYYTAQGEGLKQELVIDVGEPAPLPLKIERLTTVPLTANGGLDREQLKRQVAGSGGGHVPPQGPLEELLLKIWQNVLKAPGIGVTDDFFMLGGHSLLAVELVQRINDTCNTSLPLSVMFEAPTIRTQAALLDTGRHSREASVIPLQPLGSETPLFCICGIALYSALARRLGPEIPVYGVLLAIEGQLMTGEDVTLDVRKMATEYVAALRSKQPHGPYRVLGLSFGAVLAYEIAQQLAAAGDKVELLAMLDFVLPEGRSRSLTRTVMQKMGNLKQVADAVGRRARDMSRQFLSHAAADRGQSAAAPAALDPGAIRYQAYRHAYMTYQDSLEPYDGSAIVVRATDQIVWDGYEVAPDCGWSRYIRGGLQVVDVPGDHLSILQEPNVEVLVAHLAKKLTPWAP